MGELNPIGDEHATLVRQHAYLGSPPRRQLIMGESVAWAITSGQTILFDPDPDIPNIHRITPDDYLCNFSRKVQTIF